MKAKLTNLIGISLLLSLSVAFSLVAGEILIRSVVDSVDYLEPALIDDNILGHRIHPNSSGHDEWGFRNASKPDRAKIVAIGDSQTYGVSAPARKSWPAGLDRLVDGNVYNLSIGGYGPVQYYHLLKTKTFGLSPSVVIVGFYFGNDLFDAYSDVYKMDYWKSFRRADFPAEQFEDVNTHELTGRRSGRFLGGLRNWLARNSVTYRMFTFSFGNLYRFLEMKYSSSIADDQITVLEDREFGVRTGFRPSDRLRVLNFEDRKIQEGLRITLELTRQMKDLCSRKGVDFLVALIPTKESVFAKYVEGNDKLKNSETLSRLIANEARINQSMKNYFDVHDIRFVDVLPDLQHALPAKTIYPQSDDGHPNAEGYAVIANAIHSALKRRDL